MDTRTLERLYLYVREIRNYIDLQVQCEHNLRAIIYVNCMEHLISEELAAMKGDPFYRIQRALKIIPHDNESHRERARDAEEALEELRKRLEELEKDAKTLAAKPRSV